MLITVLLPLRDAADTVDEAVASVLAQEGVPLEVIAIDDGSRDDGPAKLRAMASRDARLAVVRSRGAGISAALSTGLAVGRGDFVARMDADDVSLPGRFARQIALFDAHPRLGAAGTRVEAFPAIGDGLARYLVWQNGLATAEDHARDLFVESPLCHPSVMLRRSALDAVGGWRDVAWAEDYDLWLRLAAAGWELAKVPEVLLRWRHHPGRATFKDPRYSLVRFTEARACYLAPVLIARGRPVCVWGAGATGKRLARALEQHGVFAERFIDIDPRKVGRTARGVPIVSPRQIAQGTHTIVVAVGAQGARDVVRGELVSRGFVEREDFVCAA